MPDQEAFLQSFRDFIQRNAQYLPSGFVLGTRDMPAAATKLGVTLDVEEPNSYAERFLTRDALISQAWRIGGRTGGNCWGGKSDHEVSVDPEPQCFAEFFDEVLPALAYRQARALLQRATLHEFTQTEYYGNYTRYAFRVLALQDLLDVLYGSAA